MMSRVQPSPGCSADTFVRLRGESQDSGAWDCLLLDTKRVAKQRRCRRTSSASGAELLPPAAAPSRFSTISEPGALRFSDEFDSKECSPLSSPSGVVATRQAAENLVALGPGALGPEKALPGDKGRAPKSGCFGRTAGRYKEWCLK